MAFRNSAISLTNANALTELYVCPIGQEVVIHSLFITNTDLQNSIEVDIKIHIQNNGAPGAIPASFYITKNAQIPSKNTLMLDKPVNLRGGDIISVQSTAATCEVIANYLSVLEDNTMPN